MSNVLIGIIGVILFIGLALAGALILGDDFKSSRNASRAAAYVSRVNQVARAAAMYELKLGQPVQTTSNLAFLTPRFLKTVPAGYELARWNQNRAAAFVTVPANEENRLMCEEVQRQTGMIGPSDPFMSSNGTIESIVVQHQTGCRSWSAGAQYAVWSSL